MKHDMALADVVNESQQPCGLAYQPENFEQIRGQLKVLAAESTKKLMDEGFAPPQIELEPYLHLRYEGTDCALMIPPNLEVKSAEHFVPDFGNFFANFLTRYQNEFGFILQGRRIIVDDVRVRGSGKTIAPKEASIPAAAEHEDPVVEKLTDVYLDSKLHKTAVYLCEKLKAGHKILGPALLIDKLSTILIETDSVAVVTSKGDLVISVGSGRERRCDETLDAVQLSIFSHRFMSIAEQMGRALQRTSISTNIKERLDFSCALFGPDGGLVSNAPHIPVHLGAMQETVQHQLRVRGSTLKPGDVLLSNHPRAGGSHLPDLTVITPVFYA
jgi:5-oxoprolinase (ATP-hydrolysing)